MCEQVTKIILFQQAAYFDSEDCVHYMAWHGESDLSADTVYVEVRRHISLAFEKVAAEADV